MVQTACWKLMGIASKLLFHLVCGLVYEFAFLVWLSLVITMDLLEIYI